MNIFANVPSRRLDSAEVPCLGRQLIFSFAANWTSVASIPPPDTRVRCNVPQGRRDGTTLSPRRFSLHHTSGG